MANYLIPNEELSISEKRYIFSIRNRMIQLPSNFPSKNKIIDENCNNCGEVKNMKHIYTCNNNIEKTNIRFEAIFGENLKQMKKVYLQFKTNYEINGKQNDINPRDPLCDPLFSLSECSNGNKS